MSILSNATQTVTHTAIDTAASAATGLDDDAMRLAGMGAKVASALNIDPKLGAAIGAAAEKALDELSDAVMHPLSSVTNFRARALQASQNVSNVYNAASSYASQAEQLATAGGADPDHVQRAIQTAAVTGGKTVGL